MLNDEIGVEDPQTEWGDYVLYRDHIPEELPGILARKQTWTDTRGGQGVVMLCSGTDPFMDPRAGDIAIQAIHALAEAGKHVRVLTRNPLLAATGHVDDPSIDLPSRDYIDILTAAAESGHLTVGSSINTLKFDLADAIEPDAPAPVHRLRGLDKLSTADIPVYVSMSPTYPTTKKADIRTLLGELKKPNPTVIFHEAINPRGDNFQGMVDAAWADGQDDLGTAFAEIRCNDTIWKEYALEHYQWAQTLSTELDLPIHICPDPDLLSLVDDSTKAWLLA